MQVYLDDRKIQPDRATFAAGLRAGVDEAARAGRVIVEVYLDGSVVADTILESPPEEDLGTELRLTSVEPRSLVRVTLLDAREALDTARDDQRRAAELIQSGKVEEALAPLSAAIQTWQAVREAVEKTAALARVPLDSLSFPGGATATDRVVDVVGGLTGRLEEIKRCLASEDWSALADALAYDMDEQAVRWQKLLAGMAEAFKPGRPG
jgi:leucyl aminopeptidase (aminopeptidase T)